MTASDQENDEIASFKDTFVFADFFKNWPKIEPQRFPKETTGEISGELEIIQYDFNSFPETKFNLSIIHEIKNRIQRCFYIIRGALLNQCGKNHKYAKAIVEASYFGTQSFLEFNITPKEITKENFLDQNGSLHICLSITQMRHYPKLPQVTLEELENDYEASDFDVN